MLKRSWFAFSLVSILATSLLANQVSICPSQYASDVIQDQIQSRWNAFQKDRKFRSFELDKPDDLLVKEFEEIRAVRKQVWELPEYERAQHLLACDLVRVSAGTAFAYNNTVPYYNASTIYLRGRYYIACEGPRSKDVPNFFRLLFTQHVTHLMRLTDAYENEEKKCHPYWENRTKKDPYQGDCLEIPVVGGSYQIRAFDMSYWKDHEGVDPDKLLTMALQVRDALFDRNDLLLVHCSAGVGRTGTFLAALAIIEAMERGEDFSIEEIVYRLSLQRACSVARSGQYITLHRLAERYFLMSGVGF